MSRYESGFHPIRWGGQLWSDTVYGLRWGGYVAAKAATFIGASVPLVAAGSEGVNMVARATRGHDILPGFIDQTHHRADMLMSGSVPEQLGGVVLSAEAAGVEAANAVAQFGGDVSGVVASWLPTGAEAAADKAGDMLADAAVAAIAGYGGVKLAMAGPDRPHRS